MPFRNASTTSPSNSIFSSLLVVMSSSKIRTARARRQRAVQTSALRDLRHVRRLGALCTLARLVLDLHAFGERLEAAACDLRMVDEEILATIFRGDEAIPLRVAEPLNGSCCHRK